MGRSEQLPSYEYITFEREVLHDNIALCDQKAGVLLALSAVLVVFCLQSLPVPKNLQSSLGPALSQYMNVSYAIAIVGFAVVAFLSLQVVAPRFLGSRSDHIFWKSHIFDLPVDQFVSQLGAIDSTDLQKEMVTHLRLLGRVCSRKYAYLGWSLFFGELSFISAVLAEAFRVYASVMAHG